jgi:hypothetical protein
MGGLLAAYLYECEIGKAIGSARVALSGNGDRSRIT